MLYYPTHINIETSDACSRRCRFCAVPRAARGGAPAQLELDVMRRLLVELDGAPAPIKIALQWGDEPLDNPDFFTYVDLARELLPQARWLLQTNGDGLDRACFSRLSRAFDALVINLYDETAARRLETHGLRYQAAARPGVIQHPGQLRPAPGRRTRPGEAIVHLNHKYRDQRWVERPTPNRDASLPCTHLWRDAAIGHDGKVYPCCRDSERAHPVGDLRQRSLLECYNSAPARRLRALMQRGAVREIKMCRACPVTRGSSFDVLRPRQVARLHAARPAAPGAPASAEEALRRAHERDPGEARLAPGQMPWGRYGYWSARGVARALGHLALPGFLPLRYEYVVGLTSALAEYIIENTRALLGDALLGLWICGGRVICRQHLRLVDPSVFVGHGEGTLPERPPRLLRELGPDVRRSSDLDLKLLVREGAFEADARTELEQQLGARLDPGSPFFPLSGHIEPRHRLLPVAASCVDARAAFLDYNRRRPELLGKGPHSLEAAVLLFDPAIPETARVVDPRAAARATLVAPRDSARRLDLDALALPDEVEALDLGERLRARHRELSAHQLIGALQDFPELEPGGVRVSDSGALHAGAIAVWAARQAGRQSIEIE